RFGRHSVRGSLQSFLAGTHPERRSRHSLFPGTRGAGDVCARLFGRAHSAAEAGELSARIEAGWRTFFLSASLAHARFLGIPHCFHGIGADPCDLPCSFYPLFRESRLEESYGREGLGVSWRL